MVFALTAIPAAVGVDAFDTPAIATALVLFAISIPIWIWGFGLAVVRSARGDDIVVGSMFGTVGDAPRRVRFHLFGALALCVAIAAGTAAADPFGERRSSRSANPHPQTRRRKVSSPRHGSFPPRRMTAQRR